MKKRISEEQIIGFLREAETGLAVKNVRAARAGTVCSGQGH